MIISRRKIGEISTGTYVLFCPTKNTIISIGILIQMFDIFYETYKWKFVIGKWILKDI